MTSMIKIYLCIKKNMFKNLLTLDYIGGNFYYFLFSLSSRNLMDI